MISAFKTKFVSNSALFYVIFLLFLSNLQVNSEHNTTHDLIDGSFKMTKVKSETGLEFLENDKSQINIDSDFFFGIELFHEQQRDDLSAVELVQMFVRNLKGFPIRKNSNPKKNSKRLDWCYKPFELKELVKAELKIYQAFKEMKLEKGNQNASFPGLESYLIDIEESSVKAKETFYNPKNEGVPDPEDIYLYIASHPLLIYRLVRRFAEDLQPILSELNSYTDKPELLNRISNDNSSLFPNYDDLSDALEALSRVQHGTDLNTYEMAKGTLEKVKTGISLNALHCLELGAYHLDKQNYDYSIQWLHMALETAQKSSALKGYPEIEDFLKGLLRKAVDQHNLHFVQKFSNPWYPEVFNTTVSLPFRPELYERRIYQLKPLATKEMRNTEWNWSMKTNFKRVCSGENLQTDLEKSYLGCWYFQPKDSYWTINPLKTELLSWHPPVYQIYEFIGDNLIEKMKQKAVSKLQRSAVVDRENPTKSKVSSTRTSSQTWLDDDMGEDKYLIPLTRRLELLTDLTMKRPLASDSYQVASYGPSHHYEAHLDSFVDPLRSVERGNRITTIMGYLSDVEVGGRTGFPVLGIFTEPIKGSIVIWENLKRNGEDREERSWHGGCPVVLGIKWITNKWIYYKENMFTFKCTLNPHE